MNFFSCFPFVLQGDNQYRNSGQALEFKELNIHAWEAFDKGQDIHMQAAPSQAELLYKNYQIVKEKLKSRTKDTIMEKYGNAASEEEVPRELLLGQSEREVEYDRAGRIIKGQVEFLLTFKPLVCFLAFSHVMKKCFYLCMRLDFYSRCSV